MQILRLSQSGDPVSWISIIEAAVLYSKEQVVWELGDCAKTIFGGHNNLDIQSSIAISPVIAVKGKLGYGELKKSLTNSALFARDDNICLYCGNQFERMLLTRDHVFPSARGGKDTWMNVVTACKKCNNHKGCRTPEEAGMELLALPFTPNDYEYMYLSGRKILADQMMYLKSRFSRNREWTQ